MNAEELAAIRERDEAWMEWGSRERAAADRRALRAHIDALTAKVEALHVYPDDMIYRPDILAILRGEA
jgi:hypothetical protein